MYWNMMEQVGSTMVVLLNSNIRCIEILFYLSNMSIEDSWIVTLDVLKLGTAYVSIVVKARWIVTLDVLKLLN